jgi:hypothetical protein
MTKNPTNLQAPLGPRHPPKMQKAKFAHENESLLRLPPSPSKAPNVQNFKKDNQYQPPSNGSCPKISPNMQNVKFAHENEPSESLPQASSPQTQDESWKNQELAPKKPIPGNQAPSPIMQNPNIAHENRFSTSTSHPSYLLANKKTYNQTSNFVSLMTKTN